MRFYLALFALMCFLTFTTLGCKNESKVQEKKTEQPTQKLPETKLDSVANHTSTPTPIISEEHNKIPVPKQNKEISALEKSSNKKADTHFGVPSAATPISKKPLNPPLSEIRADFIELTTIAPSIRLDIRYATKNNFTKAQIYDCPRCLLRPEAAKAIAEAQEILQKQGYSLKMFDCYRPRPYQQRLWDKVPNPDYVTNPAKGSMHSRGAAVDLTIVDAKGVELDMGTPYDFFGEKAHTDYTKLSEKVLNNRLLLQKTMESVGFKGIRTEWWHFSFQKKQFPLADYVWPCD
jgi:D-alanyl-D-alanine dipeptidase